jgi:heme-degrading monooxygenase HmoA
MFVRMAHWTCRPECWAEAERTFESGALPILRLQPGCLLAQLTGETGTGRRIAITYWESEAAHTQFAGSAALQEITDMFAHMYVDGVLPEGFYFPVLREGVFR